MQFIFLSAFFFFFFNGDVCVLFANLAFHLYFFSVIVYIFLNCVYHEGEVGVYALKLIPFMLSLFLVDACTDSPLSGLWVQD